MEDEDKNQISQDGNSKMAPKASEEASPNSSEVMENLLNLVGGFGRWQWYMWFVTSFSGIFTAFNNVGAAFLAAIPDHWCADRVQEEFLTPGNVTNMLKDAGVPLAILPVCDYYNLTFVEMVDYWKAGKSPDADGVQKSACSHWVYDTSEFQSTIATEWDLVCDRKWLMSTVQASSVLGFLTGGIVFSELSDMYGRRRLSLISTVGLIITGVVVAFANSYELFVALRFLLSCFAAGVFIPNFVLLMESSGEKARTYLGVMYQAIFGIGVSILALLAYFFREWRHLELALFVPSAILLLYFKILPESPHWLLENGRKEEASEVLRTIARGNNKKVDEVQFQKLISSFKESERKQHNILKVVGLFFKNQAKLFRTPILRRRCILIFFGWFVVGLVYYGLVFNSPNLNASRFALVALAGLSETSSVIVVSFTTQKFGRRMNLMSLFVICGISCVGILFVPKELVWLNITLSTIGKFANAAAFAVVYIYSAELVPTSVRNIAVGASSMWARIGSMSAPYIVDLLGDVHYAIPSTAFGVLSFAGGLAALLLPETGGKSLPNSIEEIEVLKR